MLYSLGDTPDGIWRLEPVQSWDRSEFELKCTIDPPRWISTKAQKHLGAARIEVLRKASLLDVGCGLGDC